MIQSGRKAIVEDGTFVAMKPSSRELRVAGNGLKHPQRGAAAGVWIDIICLAKYDAKGVCFANECHPWSKAKPVSSMQYNSTVLGELD